MFPPLRVRFLAVVTTATAFMACDVGLAAQSTVVRTTTGGQVCVTQPSPSDHARYAVAGRVIDDLTGAPIIGAKVRLEVAMAGCGETPLDPLLKYDGPSEIETDKEGG